MKKFAVTMALPNNKIEKFLIECTEFNMNGDYAIFMNETKFMASFYKPLAIVEKDCDLIKEITR